MKKILLVGYGHSGVSFLRDFFAEFDSVYTSPAEFWIFIMSGGIFDLQTVFERNSNFIDDSTIGRFYKLVDYIYKSDYFSEYNEEFYRFSYEFINSFRIGVTDHSMRWNSPTEKIIFPEFKKLPKFLSKMLKNKVYDNVTKINYDDCIYFLDAISKEEYIGVAKKYLEKIFALFPKKDYLALVHPIMVSGKYDEQLKYFDDSVIIRISRDPRDVFIDFKRAYSDGNKTVSAYEFVKYVRKRHFYDDYNAGLKTLNSPLLLDIQFEDFILNYNKVEKQILDFCGINPAEHVRRKQLSNPEISRKNVGLYKTYKNQDEIKYIEEQLEDYLYKDAI